MKIFLLLFTLCCALNACGTKPADDVPPPDDEKSAVDIEWFNTEFFNVGSGVCMTNMLLSSYYDTAADIDLYELFYNGPTGIQEEVTEAEQTAIGPVAFEHYPIKTQRTEMDAFLQEYLGVALDETNKKNLDQFHRSRGVRRLLSAPRRYEFPALHGHLARAERGRDDRARPMSRRAVKGIVTLKGSKGSYQFVSNKEA